MIFVVSGPSGCGKSTLIRDVRGLLGNLRFSVSHTTRKRRPSEKDGEDYHFVDRKRFERKIRRGEFAEWARVHGHWYGTSWAELREKGRRGRIVLDIDVQGARQIKDRIPEVVMIFVAPPGYAELRRRLERRKEDSPAAVERRLRDAGEEIRAAREFDFVVVNDDLGKAVEELKSIVVASACRTSERKRRVVAVLRSFTEAGGSRKKRKP
jgi:guanylate kinase